MDSEKKVIQLDIDETPNEVEESVNILRGTIQLNPTPLQTIALTSSLPNEGKSVVAFQLARSITKLNKKVLYLDCDIRNSMTMERYGIKNQVIGLTDFLLGRVGVDDILYGTSEPFLDIVFTGDVVPNPSETLSNPLFSQLLDYLKSKYDCIIVDTAPVNLVVDATLVAIHCDTTVLVVESGVTEKDTILHAKKKLESANINILGVVLNKIGSNKTGTYSYRKYGYGKYGYGYGYGYGSEKEKKHKHSKR
jgi:capsular exopolysaccharide synthesis family protein